MGKSKATPRGTPARAPGRRVRRQPAHPYPVQSLNSTPPSSRRQWRVTGTSQTAPPQVDFGVPEIPGAEHSVNNHASGQPILSTEPVQGLGPSPGVAPQPFIPDAAPSSAKVWSSQARGSSDFTDYFIWVPIVVLIGGLGIAAIVKIILNGRRAAAPRQQERPAEYHPESNHADVQIPQMLSSRGMQPSAPLLPDIRRPVPSAPVLDSGQPAGGSIQRIEATVPPPSYQDLGHAPLDTSRYPGEMDTTAEPPSYDDVMKGKYIHP